LDATRHYAPTRSARRRKATTKLREAGPLDLVTLTEELAQGPRLRGKSSDTRKRADGSVPPEAPKIKVDQRACSNEMAPWVDRGETGPHREGGLLWSARQPHGIRLNLRWRSNAPDRPKNPASRQKPRKLLEWGFRPRPTAIRPQAGENSPARRSATPPATYFAAVCVSPTSQRKENKKNKKDGEGGGMRRTANMAEKSRRRAPPKM